MAARRPARPATDATHAALPQRAGGPPWLGPHAEGACLRVVVVPNAARNGVAGVYGDAVRIRVAAVPVDGRANEALLDFLAQALDVPRRALRLDAGHGTRAKRIVVARAPEVVLARVRALLDAAEGK